MTNISLTCAFMCLPDSQRNRAETARGQQLPRASERYPVRRSRPCGAGLSPSVEGGPSPLSLQSSLLRLRLLPPGPQVEVGRNGVVYKSSG